MSEDASNEEELVMDVDTVLTLNRDLLDARIKMTKLRMKSSSNEELSKIITMISRIDDTWGSVLEQLAEAEVISNEEDPDLL